MISSWETGIAAWMVVIRVAAIGERLDRPHTESFEFGLDLLVAGLRARWGPEA
jgi:hypothetical protein